MLGALSVRAAGRRIARPTSRPATSSSTNSDSSRVPNCRRSSRLCSPRTRLCTARLTTAPPLPDADCPSRPARPGPPGGPMPPTDDNPVREAAVRRPQARTHRRSTGRSPSMLAGAGWCRAPRGRAGHREDPCRRGADPGGDAPGRDRRLEPLLRGSRRAGVLDVDRGPASRCSIGGSRRVPGGARCRRRRSRPDRPRDQGAVRRHRSAGGRTIPRRHGSGSARRSPRRCAGCSLRGRSSSSSTICTGPTRRRWTSSTLVTAGAAEHRAARRSRRTAASIRRSAPEMTDLLARLSTRAKRSPSPAPGSRGRRARSIPARRPERRRPTNCSRRWRNERAATRSSSPRSSGSCRETPGRP